MVNPTISTIGGKLLLTGALCGVLISCCNACDESDSDPDSGPVLYLDPFVPLEARVDDLLSRLTLEEKIGQMSNINPPIDRLGIPAYNWWSEALHGQARGGLATVFPQAIGLGASWDTALMRRIATAISDEARAKYHQALREDAGDRFLGLTFWSPNINIFRDPRWGRGQETYGEDPHLTGRLAVQFVEGMQGDDPNYLKTIATVKHFAVHNGPEVDRHVFDARVSPQDLHETYLPAFREAIVEGRAQSVMCAYNAVDGLPACANPTLLDTVLRHEWGFAGYVVSDCGAVGDIFYNHFAVGSWEEAAAMAVTAGTDLNCSLANFTAEYDEYAYLDIAVSKEMLVEADLDRAVRRLLMAKFKLGMFDPASQVPYAHIPFEIVDSADHRQLALEAARKSIVLLKNDNQILPLGKTLNRVAVVGPNAADPRLLLANYHGNPSQRATILDGIRQAVSPSTTVSFAPGAVVADTIPLYQPVPAGALFHEQDGGLSPGVRARYHNDVTLHRFDPVIAFEGDPVLSRVEPQIAVLASETGLPAGDFTHRDFGVIWEGILIPPQTGTYILGGFGFHNFNVYVDEKLISSYANEFLQFYADGEVELVAGQRYAIRVEYATAQQAPYFELLWQPPLPTAAELRQLAVDQVTGADVAIAVLGLSPRLENEEMPLEIDGFFGGDRTDSIQLPGPQAALLSALKATGKPLVLVLTSGSAVAVDETDIDAILHAWYPGQAGGTAVADVLFGNYNPAGRLPITLYRSVDQLGEFDDYEMSNGLGKTYRYFTGEPLFPFGHGLSYTRFAYNNLVVPAQVAAGSADDLLQVSVEVTNTGSRLGEEVVQLYIKDLVTSVPTALHELKGFARIELLPGETKTVAFTVSGRALSLIDAQGQRVLEPGAFEFTVGGGQPTGTLPTQQVIVEVTGQVVSFQL